MSSRAIPCAGLLCLKLLVLTALLVAVPARTLATQATVPDDYPTIQAALDSYADTVFVRSGAYPESLYADRGYQHLLGAPGNPTRPVVTSVRGGLSEVDGFVFAGEVRITTSVTLRNCLIESGGFGSGRNVRVADCTIFGDLESYDGQFFFERDTVIAGTIFVNPPGDCCVRRCVVLGPAAVGIRLYSDAYGEDNYVRGCETGIYISGGYNAANRNVIEDCSGTGMVVESYGVFHGASDNTIRRCGGDGMRVTGGHPVVSGNMVDSVGGTGIYVHTGGATVMGNTVGNAGGIGVDLASSDEWDYEVSPVTMVGNRVIGSTCDGAVVTGVTLRVSGNVVGRSGGRGIVATGDNVTLRSNTLYSNRRTAAELSGGLDEAVDTVDCNIADGNLGYGLEWSGTGVPVLSCNDWYGNGAGAVAGVDPGATDVSLRPLFCDVAEDDVHLGAYSPLLSLGDCGLVGALGQGCMVVDAAPGVEVPALAFAVSPNPSNGAVQFLWLGPLHCGHIDVYDIAGAKRWGQAVDGERSFLPWDGKDQEGRRLPAGVYYARLTGEGVSATARLVLVH
jgi:hypothetical protein